MTTKTIRFKADFTVESDNLIEVKEAFAEYLKTGEWTLGELQGDDDGWCMGFTDTWHYALTCWGI